MMRGHGHSNLHNKLQSNLEAMMKFGGVSSKKEAANFIFDKVEDPYITVYVNHVSSHPFAMKAPQYTPPYLHAYNFPTDRQRINDSSVTSSDKAFFEVERIHHATADTSTTTHRKHLNAAQRRSPMYTPSSAES